MRIVEIAANQFEVERFGGPPLYQIENVQKLSRISRDAARMLEFDRIVLAFAACRRQRQLAALFQTPNGEQLCPIAEEFAEHLVVLGDERTSKGNFLDWRLERYVVLVDDPGRRAFQPKVIDLQTDPVGLRLIFASLPGQLGAVGSCTARNFVEICRLSVFNVLSLANLPLTSFFAIGG